MEMKEMGYNKKMLQFKYHKEILKSITKQYKNIRRLHGYTSNE